MEEQLLYWLGQWPAFLLNFCLVVVPAITIVFGANEGWRYRHLSEFSLRQKADVSSWLFVFSLLISSAVLMSMHIKRCGVWGFFNCTGQPDPRIKYVIAAMLFFDILAAIATSIEYLQAMKEQNKQ
jgi:hypothetical protein